MSDDQTAWLIERKYNSETNYFSCYTDASYPDSKASFRSEVETALQFARKEDAEMYLKTWLHGNGSVHEHKWVDLKAAQGGTDD